MADTSHPIDLTLFSHVAAALVRLAPDDRRIEAQSLADCLETAFVMEADRQHRTGYTRGREAAEWLRDLGRTLDTFMAEHPPAPTLEDEQLALAIREAETMEPTTWH